MTANWVFSINHTGSFVCFPVLGNRKVLPFSKQWERNEGYFSGTSWKSVFTKSSISQNPTYFKLESVCNNTEFYLHFTVDNQKNIVTEVSWYMGGKIDVTKSLHKLEIIVGFLKHCFLTVIKPYNLQHQTRTSQLIPARTIQVCLLQWGEGVLLFKKSYTRKDRSPWGKELCFALSLSLCQIN